MTQKIIPLVLHRIVQDGASIGFEDVEVSMLGRITEICRGRCVSFRESSPSDVPRGNRYLLTFDDGNVSDYEIVLPILTRMDCIATFFIVVEKIGTPHHLSWPQVRELHDAGMTIGSHSLSHPDMRKLDPSGQRRELLDSRLRIEHELGVAVTSFSFPFGKFNDNLIRLARDAGYSVICTSRHGVASFMTSPLPRNSINGSMSWSVVSRTLRAASATRIMWLLEDMAKSAVQRVAGEGTYRAMRSIATKGWSQ
ncbi:MAG: polysaccharide deacetylase family protein [Pseudomonadota bacterium]